MKNPNFNSIASFTSQNNQLRTIPADLLDYNNDYDKYSGEQFADMVESIRKNGILQPLIVRAMPNGHFTILAGNNRKYCGIEAGLTVFPCIVKEGLSDEEAQLYIDETNVFQRGFSNLKISKQAEVVARRHAMMFNDDKLKAIQQEIAKLNGESAEKDSDDDDKKSKLAAVGEEYDLSKNTIARLVRINVLVPELKDIVDKKVCGIRAGVEVSYISEEYQKIIANTIIKYNYCHLEMKKAELIRKLYEDGTLTEAAVEEIILGTYVEPSAPKPAESVKSYDPVTPEPSEIDETDVIGNYNKEEYKPEPKSAASSYGNLSKSDDDDNDYVYEDDDDAVTETHAKPKTIRLSQEIMDKYFAIDNDDTVILRTIEKALEHYFSSLKN